MTPEQQLQREILLALGRLPWLRIWRNNTGVAVTRGRVVRFGKVGQGDITGIMLPSGRRVEIEVKAGKNKQSPHQVRFQQMIEKYGGLYILARSVSDAMNALQAARGQMENTTDDYQSQTQTGGLQHADSKHRRSADGPSWMLPGH